MYIMVPAVSSDSVQPVDAVTPWIARRDFPRPNRFWTPSVSRCAISHHRLCETNPQLPGASVFFNSQILTWGKAGFQLSFPSSGSCPSKWTWLDILPGQRTLGVPSNTPGQKASSYCGSYFWFHTHSVTGKTMATFRRFCRSLPADKNVYRKLWRLLSFRGCGPQMRSAITMCFFCSSIVVYLMIFFLLSTECIFSRKFAKTTKIFFFLL